MSIRRQCELLGISRSSLYYKKVEPSEEQIQLKEQLMARIDYHHTKQSYLGTRKIAKLLNNEGFEACIDYWRNIPGAKASA